MIISIRFSQRVALLCVCMCVTVLAFAQTETARRVDTIDYNKRQREVARAVTVNGTIIDASTGRPLPAIRVSYQDFSAAITDSVGNFALKVPNYNVSILVSGEGFQSKEVPLKGRRNVSATVYEDAYTSFYDIAHLPFNNVPGTVIPHAVASVETRGNWNRVVETPDSYLQGKVAGLNAIRRSGVPNAGANLFLRGFNSLYTNTQPLVVVDGIIYDNQDLGGSLHSNNYTNPLAFIDVRDIDNITVIKDASSTYGTKGANGVILITTARAKELATRIDAAAYVGVNFAPQNIPVLNPEQYRLYLSDVLQSSGLTNSQISNLPYMIDDPSNPNYYRYHQSVDWQRRVFSNSSLKNYYLKVTGGDNIAKYALSLGYATNQGLVEETKLDRYNTRFNADLNLSRRMTATANLSFTFNEQELRDQGLTPKTNPVYAALIKSPFIGVNEVSEKGIESPRLTDADTFNVSNPVALINNVRGENKNYRFLGSVGFNYSFSKPLVLSTNVGIIIDKVREQLFIPRTGVVNDTLPDGTIADSRLGSGTKRLLNVFNDTRLSYDKTFSRIHHFAARAGVRFLQSRNEQDFVTTANSATDELRSVGNGIALTRRVTGNIGKNRWLNTYIGSDYSLSNKYFVSLNLAIDGSSRFGKDISSGALGFGGNKYAVMPSIAAAWLISSERFMANAAFIDLLKFRTSYGITGNDDIGDFAAAQTYVSQNLLGMQGLVRSNISNTQLKWESVHKFNFGVDLSVLKERLNLSLDMYNNRTRDMLVEEAMPTAAGLGTARTNTGGMKNTGIEVALTGRVINQASLKWDLGFTVAKNRSTLTTLPDQADITTEYAGGTILSRVGEAPNVFFGYTTRGVYASDAEATADAFASISPTGVRIPFKGGDVRFVDLNNDKVIDQNDRTIIGNPNPDLFGSIYNHLEWKRFSFEGLFTFVQGNDIYNYTRRQLESLSGTNNQTTAVNNRWKANGQVTNIPRASFGDPTGNSRFSDRWIEDGSYFRLRTATLSYNIPIKPGMLRYSIVYLTGNNLFTLTKYLGYDPEFSATNAAIGQGVDVTMQPQHRSVQLGVRFGL